MIDFSQVAVGRAKPAVCTGAKDKVNIAGILCCTAETNSALLSNYTLIKKKIVRLKMENVRLRTGRIKSKPEHSMQSCQEGVYSVLSCVWPFATPQTVIHRAPLSMKFSTQEYWSGLPFPSPGDLPDPGIKPTSLASPSLAGVFFTTSATCSGEIQTQSCKADGIGARLACLFLVAV